MLDSVTNTVRSKITYHLFTYDNHYQVIANVIVYHLFLKDVIYLVGMKECNLNKILSISLHLL